MKLAIASILTMIIFLTGCTSQPKDVTYKQVASDTALEMMNEESDYIILDVRTQAEYDEGHIPDAICIPNETIGKEQPDQLPDKFQLIFVYCRSGNRSKQAAQKLSDMGYTNIVEIGGINDWSGDIEH